jgi:dTDP-4-dehydrorhamnose reductase
MADTLLLTGAEGYVAQRLAERLRRHVHVIGLSRRGTEGIACELLDEAALDDVARTVSPRWIVHAAGNRNITACEKTPMLAYEANVRTTMNVLRAWPDVPMIYISADYVFHGTQGSYTEASPVLPGTAYGRSKLCAEVTGALTAPGRFTTLRTSALYDQDATFLAFLQRELRQERPVDCFFDCFFSPTCIDDFAGAVLSLLTCASRPEVLHVAGPRISQFDFARKFARAFGYDADLIRPITLETADSALCPDLSLSTLLAARTIGYTPTDHDVALRRLARGAGHADVQPVPSVLQFQGPHARNDRRRGVGRDQLNRDRRVLYAWGTLSS